MDGWLKEIEKHCGSDVSVIVLANKCDIGQKTAAAGTEYGEEEDQGGLAASRGDLYGSE